MEKFAKYIDSGKLEVRRNSNGTYTVFTCPTQHFDVNSLDELTVDRFEKEIENFEESRKWGSNLLAKWRPDPEERKDSPHHYSNRED